MFVANASTTSDLDLGDMVLTEGTWWTKDDLTLTHADGVTLLRPADALDNVNADIEVALDFTHQKPVLATVTVQIIGLPSPLKAGVITLSVPPAGQLQMVQSLIFSSLAGSTASCPTERFLAETPGTSQPQPSRMDAFALHKLPFQVGYCTPAMTHTKDTLNTKDTHEHISISVYFDGLVARQPDVTARAKNLFA